MRLHLETLMVILKTSLKNFRAFTSISLLVLLYLFVEYNPLQNYYAIFSETQIKVDAQRAKLKQLVESVKIRERPTVPMITAMSPDKFAKILDITENRAIPRPKKRIDQSFEVAAPTLGKRPITKEQLAWQNTTQTARNKAILAVAKSQIKTSYSRSSTCQFWLENIVIPAVTKKGWSAYYKFSFAAANNINVPFLSVSKNTLSKATAGQIAVLNIDNKRDTTKHRTIIVERNNKDMFCYIEARKTQSFEKEACHILMFCPRSIGKLNPGMYKLYNALNK